MKNQENTPLVIGRVEYLTSKGTVRYSTEYADADVMIEEINECLDCGIPISIVLYRDKNGKTISKNFVNDLSCLPAGFKEINNPYL